MRISDWSSDVCSSDLRSSARIVTRFLRKLSLSSVLTSTRASCRSKICAPRRKAPVRKLPAVMACVSTRSEEHTSELQSLMRISYAVFCLKQKKSTPHTPIPTRQQSKIHDHKHD